MTPSDVAKCAEAVCDLPIASQAVCIQYAAEQNVSLWAKWCAERGLADYSRELLARFESWLAGTFSDDELWEVASRLQETLPTDLRTEENPSAGYAGWALADLALVALDRCEDVHQDIVHTVICYAAAAHAGIGREAVWVTLDRLSKPELEFIAGWWTRCCTRFPNLLRRDDVA